MQLPGPFVAVSIFLFYHFEEKVFGHFGNTCQSFRNDADRF